METLAYVLFSLWLLTASTVSQSTFPSVATSSCNETVSSLEGMLEKASITPIQNDPSYVMCVELPTEEDEVLDYNNMIVPFSVVIRPNEPGKRCTVTCRSNVTLPLTNYEQFPLIFNNSELVVIENVDFIGCVRPVQISWTRNVELINTTFNDFTQGGAVEISNSPNIFVDSCRFTNNTSQGIGKTRYSGNSGGLSIGYDDQERPPDIQDMPPNIVITGTTFTSNRATAAGMFKYGVSEVLKSNLYNQRGGGLAIYIGTPNYSAEIMIQDCVVEKNMAIDSGGGIYMNIRGDNNSHRIKIMDTIFLENNGPDGGGLEITQYSSIAPSRPHHIVNITNSQFISNVGSFGGGFKSIQVFVYLNSVNLYNCTFIDNTAQVGAAMYLQSIYTVPISTIAEVSVVQDCTFENNNGNRGTLFVIQNSVGIRGTTVFKNNTGPALRILHCLISLGGDISFIGNKAHPEGFSGALYISQYGQVVLKRDVNIRFINNTGNEGACIVVRGLLVSAGFPEQLYNPQCFLQYEIPTIPTQWWNVSMLFEGNQALIGPVVYTSDLNPCQWYNEVQPFFSLDSTTVWAFMDMRDNYIIHGNVSSISREDYVQTEVHSLEIPNMTEVHAPPGTIVSLEVVALDQRNRSTSAFLELLNGQNKASDDVIFEPNIAQTVVGNQQINFTYNSPKLTGTTEMILKASFLSIENIPNASLTLVHELCLPGYSLNADTGRCECREGTNTVLFCLPDQRGILLADGLWGAPPTWSRALVTETCPSGYCNCNGDAEFQEIEGCPLLYDTPAKICDDKREGLLCGSCKEGYGVGLLTNECRPYYDKIAQAYWLIPIYLIALVVVLVLIVRLGVHLPTFLRGFLFYIQVSSVAVAYLPETFNLNVEVMDCIWSATALYIPYDFSFHASLTSLESYGLRYITPLVAFVVVPIASRAGRSHSKYWHGVWTIILLMYTRAIDTAISLLHCPTLQGTLATGEPNVVTLWFFDGEKVKCFQGAHIFLAIVSILMLIFLIALIPLAALIIYHRKIKRTTPSPERVEKLAVAVTQGFKKEYKWWPVVELVCRFIFITVVLLTPGSTFVPLLFSLVLFVMHMVAQPYANKWANYAEAFALFMLVAVLALGNTTPVIIASRDLENFTLWPIFFLPVAVGGVVNILRIAYRIGKWCIAYRKKQSKKLLDEDGNPKKNRLQQFSASLSLKNVHSLRKQVTTTVVSFDDGDEEMDFEMVDMPDTNSTEELTSTAIN